MSYAARRGGLTAIVCLGVLLCWNRFPDIQPFLPLILYVVVGLATYDYQLLIPSDREQLHAGKERASNLTLAGFAFTSTSLVIGFFKAELKEGDPGAQQALLYLVVALACFVGGYLFLRYRTRRLFLHIDDALTDNGFWCIASGIASFSESAGVDNVLTAWRVIVAIYLIYLVLHFRYLLLFAAQEIASMKERT